jgi:hypothetical protein
MDELTDEVLRIVLDEFVNAGPVREVDCVTAIWRKHRLSRQLVEQAIDELHAQGYLRQAARADQ